LINIFPHLLNASNNQTESITEDSVYAVVEKMPEFTGGEAARIEFLKQNVRYPEEAQKSKKEGRVIVQFVIGSTGRVRNAKVVKSIAPSLDQEALRVVNSFPDWIPGEQNGRKVSVHKVMPITFKYVPIQNDSTTWEVNEKTIIMLDDLKMPDNFNLAILNPERIASVNVLKPFPENEKSKLIAQYGELAENGVILIKSKNDLELIPLPESLRNESSVENYICKDAEKKPEFPGGENKLFSYIGNNLKYPIIAMENGIQGIVVIRFVIDINGKVRNARVIETVDPLLDNEALQIVNSLPDWIPGEKCGKKVNVYFTLPISFSIQGEGKPRKGTKVWERNDKTIIIIDDMKMPYKFDLRMLNMNKLATYNTLKPVSNEYTKQLIEKYGEDAVNGVVLIKSNRDNTVKETMLTANTTSIDSKNESNSSNDELPQFQGGKSELHKFISHILRYPEVALEYGIKGKVIVQFIVNVNGKVENAKIVNFLDETMIVLEEIVITASGNQSLNNLKSFNMQPLEEEALRVIKKMPDWIPAEQNGEKVSVYYTLPITFNLK
ncbi:MAG: energy transducer TonB, partial [Paludibacter sp.]